MSNAVRTPFRISPSEEYAPYVSPFSMARDVPTACEAVPMLIPCEKGFRTCHTSSILKPKTAPKRPTHTTMAAVSDGMPPDVLHTSMAMGVVTDLGASDTMTSCDAPMADAIRVTQTNPTRQPTSCDKRIGNS